ncbi:unnamed protein product [marine sediment metagenome]|uniref:Uncharacterized protein n=1 Tax=marine sediment metagenome TaxID=412755 RepID=X1H243_9ZZZZ
MTSKTRTAWVSTRKGNLYILTEQSMGKKVFAMNLDNEEFTIIKQGKKTVLGHLLKVDMSPEALLEGLEIREGDKILLLPHGSGVAG